MELWIRSQDKRRLIKASDIYLDEALEYNDKKYAIKCETIDIGYYTFYRALEVLDEIQNKIHQTYICEVDPIYSKHSVEDLKLDLEHKYPDNEFIMQPPLCELKPINTNVVIYEMPKE